MISMERYYMHMPESMASIEHILEADKRNHRDSVVERICRIDGSDDVGRFGPTSYNSTVAVEITDLPMSFSVTAVNVVVALSDVDEVSVFDSALACGHGAACVDNHWCDGLRLKRQKAFQPGFKRGGLRHRR